jgi:predicted O-methyltransferase YrrM
MNQKKYTALGPGPTIAKALRRKSLDLCMEIGVFEGATSNLIARHLSKEGKLICIDPLEDKYITTDISEKTKELNETKWKYFSGQYERFIHNTKDLISSGKIELIRETSDNAFKKLGNIKNLVDFCYIDGDHRTKAVLKDGINCLAACKVGGMILFDDYKWGKGDFDCGKGIDIFLNENEDNLKILEKNQQVLVQKIK